MSAKTYQNHVQVQAMIISKTNWIMPKILENNNYKAILLIAKLHSVFEITHTLNRVERAIYIDKVTSIVPIKSSTYSTFFGQNVQSINVRFKYWGIVFLLRTPLKFFILVPI